MKKVEFFFDSRDQESKIHAVKWIPDKTPVCIVQIVHGMAEYIERYEEFACFLTEHDILVTGEDHLGHGKSIDKNPPGYFCRQDPATVAVRDVHRLKKIVQEEYPGIPYVIFGHSMGSLIARNYLTKYGTGIDGAIICATAMPDRVTLYATSFLVAVLSVLQGEKHPSMFLNKLGFGGHCKRIQNPESPFDWLSVDKENVKKYIADPLCGFCFTVNGFRTLKDLSLRLYDKDALSKIPKELPVLFLYGMNDPVGAYGKGVEKVYDAYRKEGMNHVQRRIYEEARHELLNDTVKEAVMNDVYQWLTECISLQSR